MRGQPRHQAPRPAHGGCARRRSCARGGAAGPWAAPARGRRPRTAASRTPPPRASVARRVHLRAAPARAWSGRGGQLPAGAARRGPRGVQRRPAPAAPRRTTSRPGRRGATSITSRCSSGASAARAKRTSGPLHQVERAARRRGAATPDPRVRAPPAPRRESPTRGSSTASAGWTQLHVAARGQRWCAGCRGGPRRACRAARRASTSSGAVQAQRRWTPRTRGPASSPICDSIHSCRCPSVRGSGAHAVLRAPHAGPRSGGAGAARRGAPRARAVSAAAVAGGRVGMKPPRRIAGPAAHTPRKTRLQVRRPCGRWTGSTCPSRG